MKKRILAGLLIGVLLFGGCASVKNDATAMESATQTAQTTEAVGVKQAEASEAIPKEVVTQEIVTLDVYSQLSNFSGEQTGWFAKEMLDRFNVKLNIINDRDGSYFDKKASTGDIGDIVIWGTDSDQYHSAIDQGLLLDWEKNGLLEQYGSYAESFAEE